MKKIVPIIILAMGLVSCGVSDRQLAETNRQLVSSLAKTTELLDSMRQANSELAVKVQKLESDNYWYDSGETGAKLIASGIENPEEYIAGQLRESPEAIPSEAILGGTMFFWNVQLLGREWVIADYTDGHIAGKAIYSYRTGEDGKSIEFSLMASQVD